MTSPRRFLLFCVGALLGITGCGGSNSSSYQPPVVNISLTPQNLSTVVSQTVQLTAIVTGTSNTAVTWAVKEQAGGTIHAGLYNAPNVTGIYHVVVTSVADPTKSATAEVTVWAGLFAFLEASGDAAHPSWVAPMIGRFAGDGAFTATPVVGSAGKPLSLPIEDIFHSANGAKVVFTISPDIYTTDIDFRSITKLTHATGEDLRAPQFSGDGKQIVYVKIAGCRAIWMMSADGLNQHVVRECQPINFKPGLEYFNPTFSPDGTSIGFASSEDYTYRLIDGIQTLSLVLTGDFTSETCPSGAAFGADDYPSFTSDSAQIIFSRECIVVPGFTGFYQDIYAIKTDRSIYGDLTRTGLSVLLGDATAGIVNSDPLVVADKIVFVSNRHAPNTYKNAFELYSMNMDGSGLTRLTDNGVYDGFNIDFMSYPPCWVGVNTCFE